MNRIIAAAVISSYLLGAIPNGVLIGKVFFGKDPRDYYSHNSGGTNTGRVLGKKIGLLVIVLDMLKTIIPIYINYLKRLKTLRLKQDLFLRFLFQRMQELQRF